MCLPNADLPVLGNSSSGRAKEVVPVHARSQIDGDIANPLARSRSLSSDTLAPVFLPPSFLASPNSASASRTRVDWSFIAPQSEAMDHAVLIDTSERLETRLSHRKQTIGTPSNRYSFHRPQTASFALPTIPRRVLRHHPPPTSPETVTTPRKSLMIGVKFQTLEIRKA